MDSKIISVNFGQDDQHEYIDVRLSRYVGLNDYERWPTLEEVLEGCRSLADRVIKVRRKVLADWCRLTDISSDLEEITGISQTEVWDQDLKRVIRVVANKKWAAERIRLAVVPDTPSQNYTIDPFIGWACLVEADYTGDAEVDQLIDRYRYDIIWKRGVCKE